MASSVCDRASQALDGIPPPASLEDADRYNSEALPVLERLRSELHSAAPNGPGRKLYPYADELVMSVEGVNASLSPDTSEEVIDRALTRSDRAAEEFRRKAAELGLPSCASLFGAEDDDQ